MISDIHFAQHNRVDEVIVAMPLDAEDRLKTVFGKLKGVAIDLRLSVDRLARRFQVRGISYVGDVPVLEIANRPLKHWRFMVKWLEDKCFLVILSIWLAPFFAVIALCINSIVWAPYFLYRNGLVSTTSLSECSTLRCTLTAAISLVGCEQ